jgi:hypothetical protein
MNLINSLVYLEAGYGLDDRGSIPGRDKKLFVLHSAQTGSGAHPVSYIVGTRVCFSGDQAAGA